MGKLHNSFLRYAIFVLSLLTSLSTLQQAQLYYAGKSRYIGVFDTREKAALAYEIAREKLKSDKIPSDNSAQSLKATEAAVNSARKAAFEGVNETDPRLASK
jgi:hypothetical protein